MPYHLFVLSRDTAVFMHEHPVREADGVFALDVTLPKPGHYVLISDFFPIGGSGQVLTTPIVTAGFDGDVFAAVPTLSSTARGPSGRAGRPLTCGLRPPIWWRQRTWICRSTSPTPRTASR